MTAVLRGFLAVTVPGLVLMLTLAPTPTDAPVTVVKAAPVNEWHSSVGAYADANFNPTATLDTTQVVGPSKRTTAEPCSIILFCNALDTTH